MSYIKHNFKTGDILTAAQLNEIDDQIAANETAKLDKAGGTMSGDITMGSNKIAELAAPTADGDAANKKYVDDTLTEILKWYDLPLAATETPLMDGTASVGYSGKWAQEDHVHPTDTSRAPLVSPAFTGTPTAPTAVAGTNTTQIATTAFVKAAIDAGKEVFWAQKDVTTWEELSAAVAANKIVAMRNGNYIYGLILTTAYGTTADYIFARLGAESNHVAAFPSIVSIGCRGEIRSGANTSTRVTTWDSSAHYASLATINSPALTGAPTAPTADSGTNTTQIATTAFVQTAAASKYTKPVDGIPESDLSAEVQSKLNAATEVATEEIVELDKARFFLVTNRSSGATANAAYAQSVLDDSAWREVTLPHDWSIELDFDRTSPATYEGAWLDGGEAWYRIELPVDLSMHGKRVYASFDGCSMHTEVYVNGTLVGTNEMAYNPFRYEITEELNFSGKNVMAVFVRNRQISSRYYSGSGLYRPVRLEIEPATGIEITNVVVTTPNLETQRDGLVDTVIEVRTNGDTPLAITAEIYDAAGRLVGSTSGTTATLTAQVLRPKLWSIYQGNLYTMKAIVATTTARAEKTVRFGYRYFRYDTTGFYLNGVKTFHKGVCMHHDLGCIGAEANRSAMARQLDVMIDMGVNAIRTSHNPEATALLDLCAEKGLLVMEEFFDTWSKTKKNYDFGRAFTDNWQTVVRDTIDRDINNPAIVMWSIGNEINKSKYLSGESDYSAMGAECQTINAYVKSLDPTRPTTTAISERNTTGIEQLATNVDIVGLNYASGNVYSTFHNALPDKPIFGSETTSGLASRGEYAYNQNSRARGASGESYELEDIYQCSSYDNDRVQWMGFNSAAEVLKYHMDTTPLPLFGMYIWTGWDYLGEPTPYYGWPTKSSFFGTVDLAGFPKDIFYMYQSRWTSRPMVHILPMSWDWTEGETVHVWLYSNCDKVELFLNGVSLGSKTRSQIGAKYQYEFEVTYMPGTLVANGYDTNNKLTAQDMLWTSVGEGAGLRLKAWYNCVDYRTSDLAFIECEVVDAYGVRVPDADDAVTFTVDGGTVLGTDNGNSPDTTNMHSPVRNAFHGRCLCVARHDGQPGTMTITATGEGLGQARISVEKGLYTGRVQDAPTAFVDAINPPEHPYGGSSGTPVATTYQVVAVMPHAVGSNNATEVTRGGIYLNTIAPESGYRVTGVSVSMGGKDISSTAYANNTVSISRVTGNIIVTVSTEAIKVYTITKNLTAVTLDNAAETAQEGSVYAASLTVNAGYELTSITVTMGGTDITSAAYSNGTVSIAAVTGNVVITAAAEVIVTRYSVTKTGTGVTHSNSALKVVENEAYTDTLTVDPSQYTLVSVTVTMGGTDITSTAYSNGTVSIAAVTGDIVITASTTAVVYYSVTNTLTNVSNSSQAPSIQESSTYAATLTADEGCVMQSVTVMMGSEDITSSAYDGTTGAVSIANVSGDIVITATALVHTVLRNSFSPNGAEWKDTVTPISLADGDYIEAVIDLSTCTGTEECIFSAGQEITEWAPTAANRGNYHVYYTKGQSYLNVNMTNSVTASSGSKGRYVQAPFTGTTVTLRVDERGLSVNGTVAVPIYTNKNNTTEASDGAAENNRTIGYLLAATALEIGSMEGKNRSRASYSTIKVVSGTALTVTSEATCFVTNTLLKTANSNASTSVTFGDSYTATLFADTNYTLDIVIVKMGGTDITSTAYNSTTGTISIAQVIGNIDITALARSNAAVETILKSDFAPNGASWKETLTPFSLSSGDYIEARIDLSTCTDSKEGIFSVGQDVEKWKSDTGFNYNVEYSARSDYLVCAVTAFDKDARFIQVPVDGSIVTIRMDYCGLIVNGDVIVPQYYTRGSNASTNTNGTQIAEEILARLKAATTLEIGIGNNATGNSQHATYEYIKVVKATVEAIDYYSVTANLSNVSSSNATSSVEGGSVYTATLTPESGMEITAVSVTMGGTDITSAAYSNGTVSIAAVTGNIVITASALAEIVLKSDYAPNGATWTDVVPDISLSDGDAIEAKIDLSTCTDALENILSISYNDISVWNQKAEGRGSFHMYYSAGDSVMNCSLTYGTSSDGRFLLAPFTGSEITVRLDSAGLHLNGELIQPHYKNAENTEDIGNTTRCQNLVAMLNTVDTLQVGSAEGNSRSHATYEYIRVIKA